MHHYQKAIGIFEIFTILVLLKCLLGICVTRIIAAEMGNKGRFPHMAGIRSVRMFTLNITHTIGG